MLCDFFNAKLHFLLLQLFLFFCVLCGDVSANGTSPAGSLSSTSVMKSITLFAPGDINNVLNYTGKDDDTVGKITVKSLATPFLFAADGLMVAIAEARYIKSGNNKEKTDLVAKYMETGDIIDNWGDAFIRKSAGDWKTQLVTQNNTEQNKDFFTVKAAVLSKDKKRMYVLLVGNTAAGSSKATDDHLHWEFKVAGGSVSGGQNAKKVKWTSNGAGFANDEDFKKALKETAFHTSLTQGFAFLTEKENVLFLVTGTNKNVNKNVFASIYFNHSGSESVTAHVDESAGDCNPYFLLWEKKIIMIPIGCKTNAEQKIKVFDESQNAWKEVDGLFPHLLDYLKSKKYLTSTTVAGKDVLLFTEERDDKGGKKNVYLWMSDGRRFYNAGAILTGVKDGFYCSMLHTSDELFALHQKYNNGGDVEKDTFALTRLNDKLDRIKAVLDMWDKRDDAVRKLCGDVSLCVGPLPVDGLVGFLSNSSEGDSWLDEYYYMNATVKSGEKVARGLMFAGAGAGAKWPVGPRGEEQPYDFTTRGFTLVAAVTVGGAGGAENILLGAGTSGGGVGLRCGAGGRWGVAGGGEARAECARGETYGVALVLGADGRLAIYVDGTQLTGLSDEKMRIDKSASITHFYFGSDVENVESYVIVTDVLLYNRPFTADEIGKLKVPKKGKALHPQSNNSVLYGENKSPREGSIVRGGVVGVLFSILLSCVPALTYNIIGNV